MKKLILLSVLSVCSIVRAQYPVTDAIGGLDQAQTVYAAGSFLYTSWNPITESLRVYNKRLSITDIDDYTTNVSAVVGDFVVNSLNTYTASNNQAVVDIAVAQSITSQLSTVVRQTNYAMGQFYTNFTARTIHVSIMVTNLLTVLGQAGAELQVGNTNNTTVYSADIQLNRPLLGLAVGIGSQGTLRAYIPAGGRFQVANLASGLGNSSTVGNNLAQYTLLP